MLKEIILLDLYRYSGKKDKKTLMYFLFFNPCFLFNYLFRKSKYSKICFIYRIVLRIVSTILGIQISYKTQIKEGFVIAHFGNIVINEKTEIGKNVNINTGVVIGRTNRGEKAGVPIIGNEVWIGANSIIVGKIVIGNNVLIAPGAYVNFDVPSNSIVLGNPGIIKENKLNATEDYINKKI